MIAAIKPVLFGLPQDTAHFVANLYGDLMLNDRLQRRAGVDMAAVYRKLNEIESGGESTSRVWKVYSHTYEHLWRLPPGSLSPPGLTSEMTADAALIARLIRHHAAEWLRGARRFACILYPYLQQDAQENKAQTFTLLGLGDLRSAGQCAGEGCDVDAIPDGLSAIDPAELGDLDDDLGDWLGGDDGKESSKEKPGQGLGRSRGNKGGPTRTENRKFREPVEYGDLLRALGLKLSDHEITIRYYRERAMPHLVPFPSRKMPQAKEPLAESYETWEPADSLEELDLFGSILRSPEIIPGVTTVQRVYGESPGSDPAKQPVDLYIGIDCSGSMPNPQNTISYPALAGAVIALSALRMGARVMVVLSGEPGSSLATDGFVTDERKVLGVLTSYLGTGYTFGIHRLHDTFGDRKPTDRDVYILIVTDHDIFSLLDAQGLKQFEQGQGKQPPRRPSETTLPPRKPGSVWQPANGWECARDALEKARGGGTYVLNMAVEQAQRGGQDASRRLEGSPRARLGRNRWASPGPLRGKSTRTNSRDRRTFAASGRVLALGRRDARCLLARTRGRSLGCRRRCRSVRQLLRRGP